MASKRRDLEYVSSITGFTMRHYKRKDLFFLFFWWAFLQACIEWKQFVKQFWVCVGQSKGYVFLCVFLRTTLTLIGNELRAVKLMTLLI